MYCAMTTRILLSGYARSVTEQCEPSTSSRSCPVCPPACNVERSNARYVNSPPSIRLRTKMDGEGKSPAAFELASILRIHLKLVVKSPAN
jgi:hypothetical protein